MLEQGISMGRGGVFLSLTEEHYKKLKTCFSKHLSVVKLLQFCWIPFFAKQFVS
jgi:hypothetical protein